MSPRTTARQSGDHRPANLAGHTLHRVKSPSEAMGNPASITSTPRRSSWCAMRTFSSTFMLHPGDCSPSRKVVSNIVTCSVPEPSTSSPAYQAVHATLCPQNEKGHHPVRWMMALLR